MMDSGCQQVMQYYTYFPYVCARFNQESTQPHPSDSIAIHSQ